MILQLLQLQYVIVCNSIIIHPSYQYSSSPSSGKKLPGESTRVNLRVSHRNVWMDGIAWPILDTLQKRNLILSRLGLYVYTYIHIDMCIYACIYIYSRYIGLHHITSHCVTLHHITLHHITYMTSKEQKGCVINYPSSWLYLDYIPSICLLTQEFNKNLPDKHVFMGQDPNWPRHSCTDQFSGLTSKRF